MHKLISAHDRHCICKGSATHIAVDGDREKTILYCKDCNSSWTNYVDEDEND